MHVAAVRLETPLRIEIVGLHAMSRAAVVPKRHRVLLPAKATGEVGILRVLVKQREYRIALRSGQPLYRTGSWAREKKPFPAGDRVGANKSVLRLRRFARLVCHRPVAGVGGDVLRVVAYQPVQET